MNPQEHYQEALTGIVERVTFHNSDNGWSVLRVSPFKEPHKLVTVVVHQARVVAGASMEFRGAWTNHRFAYHPLTAGGFIHDFVRHAEARRKTRR